MSSDISVQPFSQDVTLVIKDNLKRVLIAEVMVII